MRGICFIEPLFYATIGRVKNQTRRIVKGKPYKVNEILFLKEPYETDTWGDYIYKFGHPNADLIAKNLGWKNKLFMPAKAARYFIKINAVRKEKLQDISDDDIYREGISDIFLPVTHKLLGYGVIRPNLTPLCFSTSLKEAYAKLVNKANKKKIWEENPEVFVYSYSLAEKPQ